MKTAYTALLPFHPHQNNPGIGVGLKKNDSYELPQLRVDLNLGLSTTETL